MRSLVVVLAVGAMLCSSIALAAPRALSSAELDQVTAGAGLGQVFVDAFVNGLTNSTTPNNNIVEPVSATGEGGIAVEGDGNTTAGAVGDNGSASTNGEDNTAVAVSLDGGIAVDGSVAGQNNTAYIQDDGFLQLMADEIGITDSFNKYEKDFENEIDGNGNVAFNGINEGDIKVYSDNSEIDGEIKEGGAGVIAKEATVTNSFNVKETDIDVDVEIKDSFNTETNSLDISGQGEVSGIINANTLGFQNIAVNLNVTTSSSSVPNNAPSLTGLGVTGFGSAAITVLSQINVNGSIGVAIGNVVPIPLIGGIPGLE